MRLIRLRTGETATVDDEDYPRLSRFAWRCVDGYAIRKTRVNGRQIGVLMHREVIQAPVGVPVDHADRNTLDNRRANLRLATGTLNNANARKHQRRNASSCFKGVSYDPRGGTWRARIVENRKIIGLGSFKSEEAAAHAYDAAARARFGAFARTNFAEAEV